MSKTISHRPPRAKDHAASTRTDARSASHKKQKEVAPSVATAFEMLGSSISKFKKDVGDTAQRLAKSARVFAHTIRTETGRPDKNIVQAIEDGFADAAQAFAPKPDFAILADEAEEFLDTIRHAATSDPKLKSAALEMAAQYQGILGAGIASAVWDYQHDPESRPVAQRQAMDLADAFYREVPTEETLDGVFATYTAVDRDVAKLRRAVARNADTIRTHVSNEAREAAAPLLNAADRGLPMGDIQFQKPVPVGPEAIFLQAADQPHVFARAENAILEPLLTATESRITTLVQSTHAQSPFYREAHLGMAQIHMGDPKTGVCHLESARQIFRDKGDAKPPAKELATQIEVLHRIAEQSPEELQLAKDRLSEADSMIDLLALDKGSRDKATLFRVDNLLRALPHRLQEHDENLKHNPDNVEDYHRAVAREHQKIIDYCSRVKSKDPAIVSLAHGNAMIQASVQFEKRLDAAMSLRLMGEPENARLAHIDAENKFTKVQRDLETTSSPAFTQEAMGRMHWANATYTFKTGEVEQSLRDLRTLSETYGESGAAQILKDGSDEVWVHHYGIVDDHGNFSPSIGKPSQTAKWKKIADAALSDKASATKAMMAGAGVAIVGAASADALFGTHVIGGEALLTMGQAGMIGAGAGLLTERGYQVLSAQREISAAYTTGIANVTSEELADRGKALAGEVAVCFLAGGAARYVRMGVMQLGAKLRAPLLRGLLSESGVVAEGIAFHEFAGAIHGETDRSALAYFRSVLTLRTLAAGSELNLGSLLFPGEAWADAVMRHGFNTAVANIPLQAFESAIARDLSGFGQGYFDGLFGLYAITIGGKVPETIMRAPQILAQAKAVHQERSARKLLTRAETLANKISTLQSNRDYARTPTEKADLTQKLTTAMRAHAATYQQIAKMGLYPEEAATAYAEGVEAYAKVSEAAAQPAFETTPLRQLIARALLLPVAPIFGTTGPLGGGGRKVPEGDVTQVGIKRGLGDKPREVSEPPKPPPQPLTQTQSLRPKPRPPIPAFVITPRTPIGRVQVELAPPEHRAQAQKRNVRLVTQGNEAAFADAGAINHFDSGMIFFSPYAPSLFFVTAKVDAATGAIRSMKASDQKTERTPNTFGTSITVFSPWALAQLSQLHSEALKRGVNDRDPVPEWVLTKISEIVEARDKITAEGVNRGELIQVQTQYIKWFSFINSRALTLGDVFSDRVINVSSERLPAEIEVDLQTSLIGKPFRTQNAPHIKSLPKAPSEEPSRPAWLDDPRIANALWAVNPEYAPDMRTVSPQFKYNPKGDNELVYAILDISRAIAGGSPLTNSYLSRLHHLLEAISEHSDLFRPETRMDTASTESNLDAHLRAAYSESPNVVLRALELLEHAFDTPGAFRGKLRPDFRATQPVNRLGVQKGESATIPKAAEDGLAVANDAGVRKELRIPEPVVAPPKPTPPPPADIDVIRRHAETLAVALDGNLNDTIPPERYRRRDLTGLTSPSGGESVVRSRINAQTGEPLTLGLTLDVPGTEHTAVIDIRISNGKVIGVNVNSNQLLHPTVLDSIRRSLMGRPVKAKPLQQTKTEPPDTPDIQGSTPPPPNPVAAQPQRLGIVGRETDYPVNLPQHKRPTLNSDSVTAQEFHDALQDHFGPGYFGDIDLLKRRDAIVDQWTVREDEIEINAPLHATDAFLARTQVRSEAFVALLDLRVEAQLRNKVGASAKITDMDLESERNHILAEVLGDGIGADLPIAKGTISVSTVEGVIVLRPENEGDYAAIDNVIQNRNVSSEPLTGGFYCGKSALGLPFVVINPAMGDSAWTVLRHELQHLRKHASNRFEPHWKWPTPDSVTDYHNALRQHFGVQAKDETFSYLEQAYPPEETASTLTKSNGLYDDITKTRDKIQLSDDEVTALRTEHHNYITQQVWTINEVIFDLVNTGWHPESARRAVIDSLIEIPFTQWKENLPRSAEALLAAPPQRQAPPAEAHDGKRPELRRWLEMEVLPDPQHGLEKLDALAQKQKGKLKAIAIELEGNVSTDRLQILRQELQSGNSDLEQLAEVLHLMDYETHGRFQVGERRHKTLPPDKGDNSDMSQLKIINKLEQLRNLRRLVRENLKVSGLSKVQARVDRLLLIRTAHSLKILRDSAEKTLKAASTPAGLHRVPTADFSKMPVEHQLDNISKLRDAMEMATSSENLARATNLYAGFVRNSMLTQQMLGFEFEALMDIAKAHPDWMPHLRYAFFGISGRMEPSKWQKLLQSAVPVVTHKTTPRHTVSPLTKLRILNDIADYRQRLKPFTHENAHISRAINALEAALRKNAPIPQVTVRYGFLLPNMIDQTILHGAPKEVMASYFILTEGKRPPAAEDSWPDVMEMDLPLDCFVRYLVENNRRLDFDGKHITTTEHTNAAFNSFLMNNFVRRHVTIQEGLLTPEIVAHARRGMITLEVSTKPGPETIPTSPKSKAGTNASATQGTGGGKRLIETVAIKLPSKGDELDDYPAAVHSDNDHTHTFSGFGFAILRNIGGKINGGGLVYCTRIFMLDRTSGIVVDSHLPVDVTELSEFSKQFDVLLKRLRSMGMDFNTTEVQVYYGASGRPFEGHKQDGIEIAEIVRNKGLNVTASVASAFDDAAYDLSLGDGHLIAATDGSANEIRTASTNLNNLLKKLKNSGRNAEDTIVEILRTIDSQLPPDRKLNVKSIPTDANEKSAFISHLIQKLEQVDSLVYFVPSWQMGDFGKMLDHAIHGLPGLPPLPSEGDPVRGGMAVKYGGGAWIPDALKNLAAGAANVFGLTKPKAETLPLQKPSAPAIVSHWMDRLPPKLDIGDPIWVRQVEASLQGTDPYGSYRDAYMHMMHNAFATRWNGKNNPVKFNFETDPWANTRFLTALRAVRQRINTAITEYGHALIQTSNDNRSFFTFDTLGDFDEFVVTELQRIRGTEAVPESPVARPPASNDVEGARVIDLNQLLPQKALAKPTLYIEGVSIPREFKDGDRVEIGRDGSHNDISFPKDDMVSRVHALVVFERQGEFIGRVTDLSSSNGTKVIRAGVPTVLRDGERFNLKAGDVIQVGSHRIYVGEPPPRVKPSEDPNEIAPTWVIPVRFREGEDHFPPEYHPRNRDTDHIWRVQKNDSTGRERLVDIFRANARRDPTQRRWPVNFIVQSKPGAPDNSVVMVGQRFWPGQRAPEAGVKHIQISDGGYAQWAGELRGIFDAQGQLTEVQFNASSGEYGRQSLNASQDDDIRIVRNLLAKVLHLEPTKIRFVR